MNGQARWLAMGGLALNTLAVGLDGTVLSVALPTLATALHATETDLQWFSAGYLLVLAAAMLPVGLLGDRFGRKTVLLTSLALFGVGSAACALSPSPAAFIAARTLLGLAGAGIVVMNLSALTGLFTEEERPRAVGVWAAANFLALPIGPILGGWLLTHYWWGWVFLLNVPVALLGLVTALWLVPQSRASQPPGLDLAGIASSTAGLVAVTYGLIEAGVDGWGDPRALLPIVLGVVVLAGFILWERRLSGRTGGQPLIDLALLRTGSFTWSVILLALGGVVMIGVLFALPQYFQAVLGADAMGSGLRLLPLIGGMVLGAVPADRIAKRLGAKVTVALGFLVMGLGAAAGATTTVDSGTGFVAAWTAVFAVGMGLAFATAASAAVSELSAERSGVGAAVLQAMQKIGGPFGAAVMGSVISSAYQGRLDLHGLPQSAAQAARASVFGGLAAGHALHSPAFVESVRAAFVYGVDVALAVSAGIAAIGILLTVLFLPASVRRRPPVEEPLKEGLHALAN